MTGSFISASRAYRAATWLGALLALTGVVVASCGFSHPTVSASWRYRMTVTVETPEGLKSGSAVREVQDTKDIVTGKIYPKVKGEAVVIDLGKRGVLFGLMRSPVLGVDYPHLVAFYAFPPPKGADRLHYFASLKDATRTLQPGLYPQFVRFKDLNNPASVENVLEMNYNGFDPLHSTIKADHTEEFFGKGVKLREVVIESTEDPVASRIEQMLPWLHKVRMTYLDGSHHSRNSPLGLDGGAFIRNY